MKIIICHHIVIFRSLFLKTTIDVKCLEIKYALNKLGKCDNELRAPLVTVNENTQKIMDNALRHAELLN